MVYYPVIKKSPWAELDLLDVQCNNILPKCTFNPVSNTALKNPQMCNKLITDIIYIDIRINLLDNVNILNKRSVGMMLILFA